MVLRRAPATVPVGRKVSVHVVELTDVHDDVRIQVQRLGHGYLERFARAGDGRSTVDQNFEGQSYGHRVCKY